MESKVISPSLIIRGFLAILFSVGASARAEGIPEPGLTMYGVVRNVRNNANFRLSFGTINWTIRPPSGPPIVVPVFLTNLNDQFSYVLTVPFESEVAGFTISPNALRLQAAPTSYDRSNVTLTVNTIIAPASIRVPATNAFTFSGSGRGRIERVDLDVSLVLRDSDTNGLPDDWELTFFGRIGVAANDDPDHDGMSNRAEYEAGTNPNDPQSLFQLIEVQAHPSGGIRVLWSSVPEKIYDLERSTNLTSGFVTLPTGGITSASLETEYHDSEATGPGPYFYRVRLRN